MSKIIFKAGEATVFSEGKDVTAAMPEILIGAVDGPVGAAFANMMAQSKGHTAMFAVRDINQFCLLYTSDAADDRIRV
jgi:5,6,7,8-tetrahydromethanopterin hydro-lyase